MPLGFDASGSNGGSRRGSRGGGGGDRRKQPATTTTTTSKQLQQTRLQKRYAWDGNKVISLEDHEEEEEESKGAGSSAAGEQQPKRVVNTFGVQTKRSNRLRFTPDGHLVLITDLDAGELLVLDRVTRKELKRIPVGRQCAGILIEPDCSRAYVAVTGDNNVAVINLKTLEVVARIQTGTGPDGMAWAAR